MWWNLDITIEFLFENKVSWGFINKLFLDYCDNIHWSILQVDCFCLYYYS